MMTFLRYLLFRYSDGITDYFSDAVRVYALRGGEDARWAALAAAKIAGKKRRRFRIDKLARMTSNVLKNFPDKLTRKQLADRLLSLQEEIESRDGGPKDAREEKEKLLKLNEEFLYCLNQADPSIFRRKVSKVFLRFSFSEKDRRPLHG